MIKLCAHTKDCEKALDLFQEMISFDQPVDSIIFEGLIKVCATRPDYYHECFSLAEQMANEGYPVSKNTLQVLLSACANYGDVERARLVWNEIVEWDNKERAIDEKVLKAMFKTYSIALYDYSKGKRWNVGENVPKLNLADSKSTGDNLDEEKGAEINDVQIDKVQTEKENSLEIIEDKANYPHFSLTNKINMDTIKEEATKIWKQVEKDISSEKIKPSSQLLDSYLSLLCNIPHSNATEDALTFYNEAYSSLNLPYTGRTFRVLLYRLCHWKDVFPKKGVKLFQHFLEWDKQQEDEMVKKHINLSEIEKESIREIQNRGMKDFRAAFILMAKGYARVKDVDSALMTLQQLTDFRRKFYISPAPYLKEVHNVLDLCTELADKGHWGPLKKLTILCPKPNDDPMKPVRDFLGRKTIPKGWWGWKVVGPDDSTNRKVKKSSMRK